MVELKSGETFNGILCNCDFWMNCNLKDVVVTSAVQNVLYCTGIYFARTVKGSGRWPNATFEDSMSSTSGSQTRYPVQYNLTLDVLK
jgi:small nuclear ribonucleoprotein (snRNP)-like protein